MITELHVVDWRRRVQHLYAHVRDLAVEDPAAAHEYWVASRTGIFLPFWSGSKFENECSPPPVKKAS